MDAVTVEEKTSKPPIGLAVASLVLGVLAVLSSLFLIGGLLGLIGLILGIIHLRKRKTARGLAGWGTALSAIGLVITIGWCSFIAYSFMQVMNDFGGRPSAFKVQKWEGVTAPDFSVETLDGKQITLSDLKGRRVVLDMWAPWCPPCLQSIPQYVQLQNETSRDDLVIVGISFDEKEDVEAVAKEKGINYPLACVEELPSPYNDITSIPTVFFIDRNGVIQKIITGADDYETLKASALAADYTGALNEPPVTETNMETE